MSQFIKKLTQSSRGESQPIGFRRAAPAKPRPKIQLIASLAQEAAGKLSNHIAGADAVLLRITGSSSGAKAGQKTWPKAADTPRGAWLTGNRQPDPKQLAKAGYDFIVFPAGNTPLFSLPDDEVGKILELEASLSEGLLRAANELPVDAILVTTQESQGDFLTWQHRLLFQRFSALLNKPLLVPIPAKITADELQSIWEAGVAGVVTEVTPEQPQDRLRELRQVIDKLTPPLPRRHEKMEAVLPRTGREPATAAHEEEEEEEEE